MDENIETQEDEEVDYAGKIASMEVELVEAKDQTLRALAEAENTRRRAAKDKVDASSYAISSFARDLLGVADTLTRALDTGDADDPTIKGVMATAAMLQRVMERHGVAKIDANGKLFDAQFHEILMETDGENPGHVTQVLEEGYTLKGRLLRPARVGVAAVKSVAPVGSEIDTKA